MENLPYVVQLVTSGFGCGVSLRMPEDQPWGDCFPWGGGVSCSSAGDTEKGSWHTAGLGTPSAVEDDL